MPPPKAAPFCHRQAVWTLKMMSKGTSVGSSFLWPWKCRGHFKASHSLLAKKGREQSISWSWSCFVSFYLALCLYCACWASNTTCLCFSMLEKLQRAVLVGPCLVKPWASYTPMLPTPLAHFSNTIALGTTYLYTVSQLLNKQCAKC